MKRPREKGRTIKRKSTRKKAKTRNRESTCPDPRVFKIP
jgi:hypothetical protein